MRCIKQFIREKHETRKKANKLESLPGILKYLFINDFSTYLTLIINFIIRPTIRQKNTTYVLKRIF